MTPADLKYRVELAGHERFFFTRDTMKFFGDRMRNYGCRSITLRAQYDAAGDYHEEGVTREAWELYRKRAVKHGNKSSAFFDKTTFKTIHCIL
jgi:hypothetical protein